MNLRKFEIRFDEEKVKQYGKYSIKYMYYMIDTVMQERKIDKLAEGIYQAREDNEYYDSMFMACLMTFDKLDWFMRCADKWLSYHDGVVDDVLDIYKHFEVKV